MRFFVSAEVFNGQQISMGRIVRLIEAQIDIGGIVKVIKAQSDIGGIVKVIIGG